LLTEKKFLQVIPESRRRVSSTSPNPPAVAGSCTSTIKRKPVQDSNMDLIDGSGDQPPAAAGGFGPFVTIEEVS
jgi:hypothetical protein